MVVNHLEKLFVTNDSATIVKELDVIHPAAKMIVLASQQQEQEVIKTTHKQHKKTFSFTLLSLIHSLLSLFLQLLSSSHSVDRLEMEPIWWWFSVVSSWQRQRTCCRLACTPVKSFLVMKKLPRKRWKSWMASSHPPFGFHSLMVFFLFHFRTCCAESNRCEGPKTSGTYH
jgi:hypothetical protein